MHDPSSLIAITESFSEEIAQSLASFTSVLTQLRGPTGNCTHVKRFSSSDITNLLRIRSGSSDFLAAVFYDVNSFSMRKRMELRRQDN